MTLKPLQNRPVLTTEEVINAYTTLFGKIQYKTVTVLHVAAGINVSGVA
jgi:hypothetical protein